MSADTPESDPDDLPTWLRWLWLEIVIGWSLVAFLAAAGGGWLT